MPSQITLPPNVQEYINEGGIVQGQTADGDWVVDLDGYRFVVPLDQGRGLFISRTLIINAPPPPPPSPIVASGPIATTMPLSQTTLPPNVQEYINEGGIVQGQTADGDWVVDLDGYRFVVPLDQGRGLFVSRTLIGNAPPLIVGGGLPPSLPPVTDPRALPNTPIDEPGAPYGAVWSTDPVERAGGGGDPFLAPEPGDPRIYNMAPGLEPAPNYQPRQGGGVGLLILAGVALYLVTR